MATILAISSQVARGHVGLSIIVPALQRLGHEVIALPTVLLSNHPGHAHAAGLPVPAAKLAAMRDALDANGWLGRVDAVLTGYLPSAEHVQFAAETVTHIHRLRGHGHFHYLCDPVLGDDPKGLYIDARAADAIRDELIGIADIVTPNRFELAFLTGIDVHSLADARAALLRLAANVGIATSTPGDGAHEITNLMYASGTWGIARVPVRPAAPHGTGDLFSALYLAALLGPGVRASDALALATAGIDAVLAASSGQDALALSALPEPRHMPAPWPVELDADTGFDVLLAKP